MPEASKATTPRASRWQAITLSVQWTCDVCLENVANDEGYIYVLRDEPPAVIDQVDWRVTHTSCDPHLDCESIWFGVERARSIGELIGCAVSVLAELPRGRATPVTATEVGRPVVPGTALLSANAG
jgi:hypothetical protein